jgi:hypothetical protein
MFYWSSVVLEVSKLTIPRPDIFYNCSLIRKEAEN